MKDNLEIPDPLYEVGDASKLIRRVSKYTLRKLLIKSIYSNPSNR
jgi:hypothetical protein